MAHLTKAVVEAAEPPAGGQIFLRDDAIKGFALRVIATGAKSFVWEGRIRGRMRRVTIGRYPDLPVAAARQKATEIRAAIGRGEDPAEARQAERKQATLADLSTVYMERHARPHKRSWREDENLLQRYIPAGWNSRRLSDISRADVARLHAKIGEEHGQSAANHLIRLLRAMFNLGRDWEMLKVDNPAARIKLFSENPRERYLTPEELARVNAALLEEPDWRWRAYFPLALMLGTRRNELLSVRWADIDFSARTMVLPETKTGRHLLPLPQAAIAILETLPSSGQSEWIFPSKSASGHIVEPAKAWQRLRKRAGVPDVRIHDLRHTLASWLVGAGYNLPLIGRALNHSQIATTERYAHLALAPLREALEHTAALMFGPSPGEPKPEPPAPPAEG